MRKLGVALAAAGLVGMAAVPAIAQGRRPGGSTNGPSGGTAAGSRDNGPLNLQSAQLGSVSLARAARERMAAGECAAALDLFDQALRSSTDATLNRDRGKCHEKLGHLYPAMDDYRAYVGSMPDAPDAPAIRERLDRIEADTSPEETGAKESRNDDIPPSEPIMGDAKGGEVPADSTAAPATVPGAGETTADEAAEEELRSALRAGKGFALAPILGAHKWIRDGASFADAETWAETVGLEIRYSTAPHGAVLLDLAYEHADSTVLDVEEVAGFSSFLAYELRFPLDRRYDNQLTLAPGLGYEQLAYSPGNSGTSSYSEGALSGRLRFGYRHMVAASTSVDLSIEGGAAYFFKFDSAIDGHDTVAGIVGTQVALVWGL